MNRVFQLSSHPEVVDYRGIRLWRKALLQGRDRLLEALSVDTGRSPSENFLLEWSAVESALDFLEKNVDPLLGPTRIDSNLPKTLGKRVLLQRRIPLGRLLIVGTWNYPVALHLVQILFGLAAGNRVVFKPSPLSPSIGRAFEALLRSFISEDQFQIWNPLQPQECVDAVERGDFQGVIFTGGTRGAQVFSRACGAAMIPFVCEASGSEAAIVLGNDRTQTIHENADHLLWAAFHNSGQTCVAPRFWFVPVTQLNTYFAIAKQKLIEGRQALQSRVLLKSESVALEHEAWRTWVTALEGIEIFSSPERPEFSIAKLGRVECLSPECPASFGPGVLIVGYSSLEDVVERIRKSPWSLMSSIFGPADSIEINRKILSRLDASIVSIGECVISCGDAAIPFGGRGRSGFGVCHGAEGLMQLSRSQTWVDVKSWPGLSGVRPSWSHLHQLNSIANVLMDLKDQPLKAFSRFFNRFNHQGEERGL